MLRYVLLIFFILIFSSFFEPFCFPQSTIVQGIETRHFKKITISPLDDRILFLATAKTLLKSANGGETFYKVARFVDEEIQQIFIDPSLGNTLYIATSRHLYLFTDRLQKIYSCSEGENILTATISLRPTTLYLGTTCGLYTADATILCWKKYPTLENPAVSAICVDDQEIYIGTNNGVYHLNRHGVKEKILITQETTESETNFSYPTYVIKASLKNRNILWVGTTKGLFKVYVAERRGEKILLNGIAHSAIYAIAEKNNDTDTLYIGTRHGLWIINIPCNHALAYNTPNITCAVFDICFSSNGTLYAATSHGLLKENSSPSSSQQNQDALNDLLMDEPSIDELHRAALRYNEVHPEKIEMWRRALKFRALLPEVKLSYDKTIYGGYGASYQGTTIGPLDWSISFAWELGDLIWNIHENDVDMRSKLTTQLRFDILDEINRVYFERIRLKKELACSAESIDKGTKFTNQLRLKELTATLDGYTGGYFSRRKRDLNSKIKIRE